MKSLSQLALSVLDLVPYPQGRTISDAFSASRELVQHAEELGYQRYWLAEHHNIEGIASAATPVLIGHLAQVTKKIRVGSGGIMLPNHAPLIVAEQFGTLDLLYPGRIDLGLGRAPGTDPLTMRALRRGGMPGGEAFDAMLDELRHYFAPVELGQKIKAIPGAGQVIPIWILGSSLYSAHVAAAYGLPYAFASHFAPQMMMQALAIYRAEFRPSTQLDKPYVMVGSTIVAADTQAHADYLATTVYQQFLNLIRGTRAQGRPPVATMDGVWSPAEEAAVRGMLDTMIVGDQDTVASGLLALVERTGADEVIIPSGLFEHSDRMKSYEIIAKAKRTVL